MLYGVMKSGGIPCFPGALLVYGQGQSLQQPLFYYILLKNSFKTNIEILCVTV